jgi:hypothetical protein
MGAIVALAGCGGGTAAPSDALFWVGGSPISGSVGQPVTMENIEVTLLEARCSEDNHPKDNYVWAGFHVRLHNATPIAWTKNPIRQYSARADGQWPGDKAYAGDGFPTEWQPAVNSRVAPGATEEGWVVYSLPGPQDNLSFGFFHKGAVPDVAVEWEVTC